MRPKQFIPRIKPIQQTRPLNDKEQGLAITMSATVHYLIRCLDQMKDTQLYSQRLKMVAKQMETELEKHAQLNVWGEPIEGVDTNAAADQMDEIAQLLHNLLMIALGLGELHQAQQPLFWQEMQKQFKRFGVPLMLDTEGTLEIHYPQMVAAL